MISVSSSGLLDLRVRHASPSQSQTYSPLASEGKILGTIRGQYWLAELSL